MPYQINNFNGNRLTILEDGTLDSTTDLNLVGKNFAGYGEVQNENFVWLLENFASGSAPGKALIGQLWYDTSAQRIKVYSGSSWNIVGGIDVSNIQPVDPNPGDGWLDSDSGKYYIFDGSAFQFVGPESVEGYGVTRNVSDTITDSLDNVVPVIKTVINDTVLAIFADRDFIIGTSTPVVGFSEIKAGLNLSTAALVNGNINGNAGSANRLSTARNINGVSFDGTVDIEITSSTSESLTPGDYIVGPTFDGSIPITWDIDASSDNIQDTVVARDSLGNFSASLITSNLVGDTLGTHTGNVIGGVTGNVVGNLVGNVTGDLVGSVIGNVTGSVDGSVTGNVKGSLIAQDDTLAYDGTTKTFTGTFVGNSSTASKLVSPVTINGVSFDGSANIVVSDDTKLLKTGGTLTGTLTLHSNPVSSLQAATKQYVDDQDEILRDDLLTFIPTNYTITYGNTQYSQTGYSNTTSGFVNSANYFDVFPPAGKTMTDLAAFLPSIAVIHYAGGVDGNDSLRCTWSNLGDRIRVWVQNTEQRSTPAANWIAIWR